MSIITNQRRIFLGLVSEVRPEWRSRTDLPARIRRLLSRSGRFGSRDRRLYRELLYTTVRYLPWIEPLLDARPDEAASRVAWLAEETPTTSAYRAELTEGWPDRPESAGEAAVLLEEDPQALLPEWIARECPAALEPAELDALHRRARLWLRLQGVEGGMSHDLPRELAELGWELRPSGLLPDAFEARGEGDLTTTPPFLRGGFEVQDLGSQLILDAIQVEEGGRWLDACAGAGGKTLQLAQRLGPLGSVDGYDIRSAPLRELARRVERQANPIGLAAVNILSAPPAAEYDGVLVDAPCSGSGTWRRSPHLKWTTTPAELERQATRQLELLSGFAERVRPGGLLVYATCSLCRSENQAVVVAFLENHPSFQEEAPARAFGYPPGEPGLSILPARHDTDGFYLAGLRRRG
jgi:16S rRNA (cytosine967-C5)-methyltransferase